MAKTVLILGGARSGKSRFAQQLADQIGSHDVLFVATAEAGDMEMSRRIRIHQSTRPSKWKTLEVPRDVGAVLEQSAPRQTVVLVDCLTLLVSNVVCGCGENPDADVAEKRVMSEIETLLEFFEKRPGTVILVSDEVGLGVVPEYPLGRLFRDLLGWANQAVAARSDATYMMIAGLPIELKSIATTVSQAAAKIGA